MHACIEFRAFLSQGGGEKGNSLPLTNPPPKKKTIFKVECIKKNLFLLKRKNTTIVLLTGSVLEKHNRINYIFIFCTHSSLRACASLVSPPSALYEKLQDYSDALDAPLGMSHLLKIFVGLMFFLLESHMKSFKSTGYQI